MRAEVDKRITAPKEVLIDLIEASGKGSLQKPSDCESIPSTVGKEEPGSLKQARKTVPSDMGAPSIDQAIMETGFPLLDLTGTLIWQKVSGT